MATGKSSNLLTPTPNGNFLSCYVSYPVEGPAAETYEMMQAAWDVAYGNLEIMVEEAYEEEKRNADKALSNLSPNES